MSLFYESLTLGTNKLERSFKCSNLSPPTIRDKEKKNKCHSFYKSLILMKNKLARSFLVRLL
jgi:hypothetical protein